MRSREFDRMLLEAPEGSRLIYRWEAARIVRESRATKNKEVWRDENGIRIQVTRKPWLIWTIREYDQ